MLSAATTISSSAARADIISRSIAVCLVLGADAGSAALQHANVQALKRNSLSLEVWPQSHYLHRCHSGTILGSPLRG